MIQHVLDPREGPVGPTVFPEGTTLPIYAVARGVYSQDQATGIATALLGPSLLPGREILPHTFRWEKRVGPDENNFMSLDINVNTGDVWLQSSDMWRPKVRGLPCVSRDDTNLPPWADLDEQLSSLRLYPRSTGGIALRVEPAWERSAHAAVWRNEVRTDCDLNVTRSYSIFFALPFGEVPAAGYGTKLSASYAHDGELRGLHSSWAPVTRKLLDAEIIRQAESDAYFASLFPNTAGVTFNSTLAYRVLDYERAAFLAPCWRYAASFTIDGRRFAADYVLPATRFDASVERGEPGDDLAKLACRLSTGEIDWGTTQPPRSLISFLDRLGGQMPFSRVTVSALAQMLQDKRWACRAFGDELALETDWDRLLKGSAGMADLAWYVGHADGGGFILNEPDRVKFTCGDAVFGGNLRWVVIDACGSLQDIAIVNAGSVFDRWNSAFKGLHALLGFGTTQTPQGLQAPFALQLALAGDPLARSWFRAVQTHQANTCSDGVPWVGGMFAIAGDESAIDDRLPGIGTQLGGGLDEDTFLAVWIPLA